MRPNHGETVSNVDILRAALKAHMAGDSVQAAALYSRLAALEPENVSAWYYLGIIEYAQRNYALARAHVGRAIALKPDYTGALVSMASICLAMGDLPGARRAAENAATAEPGNISAQSMYGRVLKMCGDFEPALQAFQTACRLDPSSLDAHDSAIWLLARLRRHQSALDLCRTFQRLNPGSAEPHFWRGNLCVEMGTVEEAEKAFAKAIALNPNYAAAYSNLGNLYLKTDETAKAAVNFAKAVEIDPKMAEAHLNLLMAYERLHDTEGVAAGTEKLATLQPDTLSAKVQIFVRRRDGCFWENIDVAEESLLADVALTQERLPPFAFISMHCAPAVHLKIARLWASQFEREPIFPSERRERAGRKIKIGYLSGDFHEHATAYLTAELFELHDRSRFEIYGYSYGMDDASPMRRRLEKAFDHFVDLRMLDDGEAAKRIHADGIDVLVETKGYTQLARSQIAFYRPAPIQVSYLAYPGSLGSRQFDYVIADPVVLPMDQQTFYDEKIVHLPDCYQPNDTRRVISATGPSRAVCGLPETGFVFCAFNRSYKITPRFFALWMRLLKAVPDSVLWLYESNALATRNLRREAQSQGVDPKRLIFAGPLPLADHLARHVHADIILDNLPYGAHTTASDALWAGVPIVTVLGEAFPGRVGASLLYAAGLPELVTDNLADYEALALRLATDRDFLESMRGKLRASRHQCALFDTSKYCAHIESAFLRMIEIFDAGEAPRPFSVAR